MPKTKKRWVEDHLGLIAIFLGVAVLVGSIFFYCIRETLPMTDDIRNIIFILAAIGAFYGLHMRTEQLKLGIKTQAEENISRAVKQIDGKSLTVRCVGVHILQSVAEEYPEKTQIVTDTLMHFLESRCPFIIEANREKSDEEITEAEELQDPHRLIYAKPPNRKKRKDVELALRALGKIVPEEKRKEIKFSDLDFRDLDLYEIDFRKFEFYGVRLSGSNLIAADLRGSIFNFSYVDHASLSHAKLQKSLLVYINFKGTDIRDAIFYRTDCTGCDFRKAQYDYITPPTGSYVRRQFHRKSQDQMNGIIYDEHGVQSIPQLPDDLELPDNGAYKIVYDESGKPWRQLRDGERIDPV